MCCEWISSLSLFARSLPSHRCGAVPWWGKDRLLYTSWLLGWLLPLLSTPLSFVTFLLCHLCFPCLPTTERSCVGEISFSYFLDCLVAALTVCYFGLFPLLANVVLSFFSVASACCFLAVILVPCSFRIFKPANEVKAGKSLSHLWSFLIIVNKLN